MRTFDTFGPAHLSAITLTIIMPLALAWWARRGNSEKRLRLIGTAIAVLLVGQIVVLFFWINRGPAPRWQDMLPLHVCDFMVFACAYACVTRKRFAFEIAYFWGLAGTAHGLVTPDLDQGFPAAQFWFFFLGHGGIIGAVIFMLVGQRLRPAPSSVARAYAALLVYASIAGAFNVVFKTNYGFLCEKPRAGSLLDLLGPWPWYIGSLAAVGLVSFVILYVPWAVADARRRRT